VRLFVALPVPAAVRERLRSAVDGLDDRYPELRWTRPGGWHVTLAFLGEVPDDELDTVARTVGEAVAAGPSPAPTLRLGEPGRFGRTVAWIGVADDPPGTVAALGDAVQAALVDAGITLDRREVHPHLTLARARRGAGLPRHLLDDLPRVEAGWTPEAVVTYRSHLERGGAVYEPVARSGW
jgi:2'-5' RNA ligase